MAAEVGRQFRSNKRDLVTRDFLSCAVTGSKELDLDHKIPFGWERHLDLSSGETTYIEHKSDPKLQDLNLPPVKKDNSAFVLKNLLPSCHRTNYQSVCTLDKVKYALERASRESQNVKQRSDGSDSSSKLNSSSESMDGSDSPMKLVATGCPSCLMYVLVSKESPKCPRCNAQVPDYIFMKKKPKIDLNC